MARNSLLTEFEKGFITASRSRGETIRKIASNLKRSKSAVGSYQSGNRSTFFGTGTERQV